MHSCNNIQIFGFIQTYEQTDENHGQQEVPVRPEDSYNPPTDALNETVKYLKIPLLTPAIHIVSISLQKERNRVLRNVSENWSAPLQWQQYRAWYSLR